MHIRFVPIERANEVVPQLNSGLAWKADTVIKYLPENWDRSILIGGIFQCYESLWSLANPGALAMPFRMFRPSWWRKAFVEGDHLAAIPELWDFIVVVAERGVHVIDKQRTQIFYSDWVGLQIEGASSSVIASTLTNSSGQSVRLTLGNKYGTNDPRSMHFEMIHTLSTRAKSDSGIDFVIDASVLGANGVDLPEFSPIEVRVSSAGVSIASIGSQEPLATAPPDQVESVGVVSDGYTAFGHTSAFSVGGSRLITHIPNDYAASHAIDTWLYFRTNSWEVLVASYSLTPEDIFSLGPSWLRTQAQSCDLLPASRSLLPATTDQIPITEKSVVAEELRQLAEMHREGMLTESEFAAAKRRVLGE